MMKYEDTKSDLPYEPSTIENVDMALYNWLNEKMNLFTDTNKGWKKIPVIWITGERSWQVKNNKSLRDSQNNFILPSITLERTDIAKERNNKGKYWGDVRPFGDEKGGSIAIHKVIKQDKTRNFASSASKRLTGQPNFKKENNKVVYQTKFVSMPVYATMTYVVDIKTEYQQQMNELLQPFLTETGAVSYFIISNEGHRYEAFIEPSYSQKNNVNDLQQNERLFNTQITIKVLAHLVGKGRNDDRPKISVRENIVEIKFPKEHIILSENQFVYPPQPKKWIQTQKLVASDPDGSPEGDQFSYSSVAFSPTGETLVVGARSDEENDGTYAGAAYIFQKGAAGYQQVQKLTASFGTDGLPEVSPEEDRFGASVTFSLEAEKLVIGAYGDEEAGGPFAGAVYIFASGSGGYQQVQKLTASFGTDGLPEVSPQSDFFSGKISISSNGEILAVSANQDEENGGTYAGAVYIFASGSGGYQQVQKLTASFGTDGLPEASPARDFFGTSTALSSTGEILAVGAEYDEEGGIDSGTYTGAGAVYIFQSGSSGYQQVQKLTASFGTDGLPEVSPANDRFGRPVALSATGETLAIGATNDEENGVSGAGSVYIFQSGSSGYQQVQKLTASFGTDGLPEVSPEGDNFGSAIVLSSTGETLVVGATGDEEAGGPVAGAVYIFQSGSSGYQQVQKLIPSLGTDGLPEVSPQYDYFGNAIAFSETGETLAVGAWQDEENGGSGAGSVYVFRYTDDY